MTPSCSWWAGRIRWCTRRTDRTRTSTARRCTWARPDRRVSGCDDTRNAGLVTHPAVQTIPSDPSQAAAGFPWIGFQGRWGEQQPAFFNGPTGPNLKEQWTEPIRWSQSWRDRAYAVPAGGAAGNAHHRLLLRRHGRRLAAAVAGGQRPVADHRGRAGRAGARRVRPQAGDLAPDGAVAAGAPAGMGPDPFGCGPHVRLPAASVHRDRGADPARLAGDHDPAGDRAARFQPVRRRGRRRGGRRLRAGGGGDRHGADAAGAGGHAGGDGAGNDRARRGPYGAPDPRPTGWRCGGCGRCWVRS